MEFIEFRKTAENDASDGFGSNFSGATFCLSHQLVGFLFNLWIGKRYQISVCCILSVCKASTHLKSKKVATQINLSSVKVWNDGDKNEPPFSSDNYEIAKSFVLFVSDIFINRCFLMN